jgi:hypothetical protein
MINQRIPEPVRPILERYISSVEQELPGLIRGFYVVGSIALNGFNERFSDIDFVAVLARSASTTEMETIAAIHKALEKCFPRWEMSGTYVQISDLGRSEETTHPHPHFHDGKFHREGKIAVNPVTWWELKNHGIAIRGEEPQELPFNVDWNLLLAWMRENLNTYWHGWTVRLDRRLIMLSDWGIKWTVLGVLRQYYTFRENSITTKLGAAEYALTSLPGMWHPLVQEAIDIRASEKRRHYRSRLVRMMDAVKLIECIIQISNDMESRQHMAA